MAYHLPAAQLAKDLAFHNLPPFSSSSSFSSPSFVAAAKTAIMPSSTFSPEQMKTTAPTPLSASAGFGRGGHEQRITLTSTDVAASSNPARVTKRIGYLGVEDNTRSVIQSSSVALNEPLESRAPHNGHPTHAVNASTSSCSSIIKNAVATAAITQTDGANPLRSLKPNNRAEGQGHRSTALLTGPPGASFPSAAEDLDLPLIATSSLPILSSTFPRLRININNNNKNNNNNPSAPPDHLTLLLLGLVFLVMGLLSYALHSCLHIYFPPHVLPCVESSSFLHGWRGQRVPRGSDFLDRDEREGDDYGWPSSGYCSDQGRSTDRDAPSPPHPVPSQQQQDKSGPRKLSALHRLKTHITNMLLHHRRLGPGPGAPNPPERDLEAFQLLEPTLYTSSLAPSDPTSGEASELLKARYRNPFDWSPTPTPSPVAHPAASSYFGETEGGIGSESPLGLSRYFESGGVGIREL